MNNWTKVLEAQGIATDSAGLAAQRYKIYLEGLEATQNRFTAEWEKFWSGQINSQAIKDVINLGTSLLKLADNFDLVTLAIATLSVVAITNLLTNLPRIILFVESLTVNLGGLSKAVTVLSTAFEAGSAAGGVSGLLGGVGAMAAAAPVAAVLLGVAVAVGALYAAWKIFDAEQKAWFPTSLQTSQAFDTITSSIEGNRKELTDLATEYEGLANKQNKSAEDIKRLADISEILNTKYGASKDGVNVYTGAIDNNSESIRKNIDWIKKQIAAQDEKFLVDNKGSFDKAKSYMDTPSQGNTAEGKGVKPEEELKFLNAEIAAGRDFLGVNSKKRDELQKNIALYQSIIDQYESYQSKVGHKDVAEQTGNQLIYQLTMEGLKSLQQPADDSKQAIDDLNGALVKLNDSMQTIMKTQKDNGEISMDQVDILKKEFATNDQWLSLITVEGDKIKLNTQALKDILKARVDDIITVLKHSEVMGQDNSAIEKQISLWQAYKVQIQEGDSTVKDAAQAAKDQKAAYDDLLKTTIDMIKQRTEAEKQGLQDDLSAYKDSIDAKKQLLQDSADAQKTALKDQLDGYKQIIDAEKALIDQRQATNDYNDNVAGKNKEISDIDAQLLAIQFDNSQEANAKRLKLESDRVAKTKELGKIQNDYSVKGQKDALDKEYTDFERKNKLEQTAIDNNLKYQTRALDAQYKAYEANIKSQIKVLDKYLQDTGRITADAISLMRGQSQAFYVDLINWNRQYGDSIDSSITAKWNKAFNALLKYNNEANRVTQRVGGGIDLNAGDEGPVRKYHDGGVVGSASGDSEVMALLLKKEVVVAPPQISNFLRNTIPNIMSMGGDQISINMPLTVNGNLESGILPKIKDLVLSTVNTALKDRGTRRNAFSYSS